MGYAILVVVAVAVFGAQPAFYSLSGPVLSGESAPG
jgi:hypothetical protein